MASLCFVRLPTETSLHTQIGLNIFGSSLPLPSIGPNKLNLIFWGPRQWTNCSLGLALRLGLNVHVFFSWFIVLSCNQTFKILEELSSWGNEKEKVHNDERKQKNQLSNCSKTNLYQHVSEYYHFSSTFLGHILTSLYYLDPKLNTTMHNGWANSSSTEVKNT